MTAWEIRPHDVLVFLASQDPDRRLEVRAVDGDRVTLRCWDESDRPSDAVRGMAELAALDPCPVVVTIMASTPDPFACRRRTPDVTDAVTDVTAVTRPVTDVTDAVTPVSTGRVCACGCGAPVISTHPAARYASPACRVRTNRRKRG